MGKDSGPVTAGLLIIGNEILSGRTRDTNTTFLATQLNDIGIRLMEVRVVGDEHDAIKAAVNALRRSSDYVFTTGGIGPTHDDITAAAIADAFSLDLVTNADAKARLQGQYGPGEINEARKRMARTPEGAILIDNPISAAPGFQIGNVFVMAGIPRIMKAMFESIRHRLVGGAPLLSRTIRTGLGEGTLADDLGRLQDAFPDIQIGSYPSMATARFGVRIVLRSVDAGHLDAAVGQAMEMVRRLGGDAKELDIKS